MTTLIRRSIVLVSMLVLSMGIALTLPAFAQVANCTGQPDGTVCNDGNSCTAGDTCTADGCAGTMIVDNGVRLDRLAPGNPAAVISWDLAPGATGSDVVRGLVSALPVSPTDTGEILLVRNTGSNNYQDSNVPAPGACFWYLVRGRTACGGGPWGFAARNGLATTQRQPREGCVVNVNAAPRYFDHSLTVTDISTCIEWEKKSQPGESAIHNVGNHSDWDTANGSWMSSVNAESFAGRSDWRVPSSGELQSIVETGHGSPMINPTFGPTAAGITWSSSSLDSGTAWAVNFDTGALSFVPKGFTFCYVRAARGGP